MTKETLTCKDCAAFFSEEEATQEAMPGVCTLNPPQMILGNETAVDGTLTEQVVMSAFPEVDGYKTWCMQLIKITATALILCACGCAPNANLGGQSILGRAWSNFVNNRPGTPEYHRTHVVCTTRNIGYGDFVECR
jgi:hypothetical protein